LTTAIFISVRTGSTRLPNKCLKKISGITTIEHLINRLKKTKVAEKLILCTTKKISDDVLCDIAKNNNIEYFRGSEEDKLMRWYYACKQYDIDKFVNVDGDDIFFDSGLADLVLETIKNNHIDFIDGQGLYNDVYGMTFSGLEKVINAKSSESTEFIKNFYYDISDKIKIKSLDNYPELYKKRRIRLTLDYQEDLELFTKVINHFTDNKIPMKFNSIIQYIEENDLSKINYHREADWAKNQEIKFNV
jgi:spore coat polysaccharide biosynthesis protein SpsF